MPKQKDNIHKINYFQLILGLLLNILVIIVALIVYHEVFRENNQNGNTNTIPGKPAIEAPLPPTDTTP